MKYSRCLLLALSLLTLSVGCRSKEGPATAGGKGGDGKLPVFSLAWSEYPSWSVFGVADELELIDGQEGATGEIEKKYGVDIVLEANGYDTCLNRFGSGNCDAVCMTNMDALIVSATRAGVAVLPTSTSNGADACIVVGIDDLEQLKPHKVYGLDGTVSKYCFTRCIEELEKQQQKGFKPEDFQFTNQDPAAAAVAMQQGAESHQAIMVWNPFVLQTLKDRPDAKVLFDSSMIPGEIVDMVVMGKDSLEKPGADKFVQALIETFYRMNEELAKPDTGDDVLLAVGKKFSNLELDEMKTAVQQTKFYKSADEGIELLDGDDFVTTMQTVNDFCVQQGLVKDPSYGFDAQSPVALLFDSSHLKTWKGQ